MVLAEYDGVKAEAISPGALLQHRPKERTVVDW
jgi:hypothetical protein